MRKLQNQYLHSNTGDGTLPQAIPGGTRPKVGGAHDNFLSDLFFVTVGFVYSRVIFLTHFYTQSDVHVTLHGSRRATQCVCVARTHTIFMPSMICVSLSVGCVLDE